MSCPFEGLISPRSLRLFALIWFPAFLGMLGLMLWRKAGWLGAAVGLWAAALAVGVAGAVSPQSVRPVFLGTMRLTRPIGLMVSQAVLTLVYLLLFTPLGLTMRALGYDPMFRRFDREAPSYWRLRKASDDVGRYFRQS